MRVKVTLSCTECKQRNYNTMKNKKNNPDRLEMNKYCRFCKKHTANKPKKPNIFVRAGKAIARFFKDFRGEIKKITWPDAKTVLKSTGVVIAVILIIGIGIWIVDFGLSQGLSLIEGLAQDPTTTAAAAESTSGVTNAAAGVIQLFGGLLG